MPAILVTTDLSAPAALAYPVAVQMAQALRCELRLLHVVHRPVLAPALSDSAEQDREAAARELAAVAGRFAGVTARTDVVIAEDVRAEICRQAERVGARFLVVAASGKSGWQRLRLGSVSRMLLHSAPVPVVLVPSGGGPPVEPRVVVLTTDLTAGAMRALSVAQELAAARHLPLTLLGAATDANAAQAQLEIVRRQAAGAAADMSAAVAMQREGVEGAIASWAAEHGAAFVCMAPRARGSLERLLFGSVVDGVVARLSVPAVVVPPQA